MMRVPREDFPRFGLTEAAQAARVPGLERQIGMLEQEQARVVQLADALRRLEAQYQQVREMLGADQPAADEVYLPPADSAEP